MVDIQWSLLKKKKKVTQASSPSAIWENLAPYLFMPDGLMSGCQPLANNEEQEVRGIRSYRGLDQVAKNRLRLTLT